MARAFSRGQCPRWNPDRVQDPGIDKLVEETVNPPIGEITFEKMRDLYNDLKGIVIHEECQMRLKKRLKSG